METKNKKNFDEVREMILDNYFVEPHFILKPFMRLLGHATTKDEFREMLKKSDEEIDNIELIKSCHKRLKALERKLKVK